MRIKNVRTILILVVILVFAAIIRLIKISEVPPSLNWDELSHGYNAYSILTTGKDEWGVVFPTIFRAFGDYKLPVYIYTTTLTIATFGLTTLAVRLPSFIAGMSVVLFTFFLVRNLLNNNGNPLLSEQKNNLVSLISGLLVAVEPWSFFLSRGAFEANLALGLFVPGVYFFLRGIKNPKFLLISSLLVGLSVWTYNSYRLFAPLFSFVLIILYRQELKKAYIKGKGIFIISLAVLAFLFGSMFWQLLDPIGQARFAKVTIIDPGAIATIEDSRAKANYSPAIERLVYNKFTYGTQRIFMNWALNFSTDFLFINGGSHYQYNVPQTGLLYFLNLPFLVIGLIYLGTILSKKSKSGILLIMWIILAPLPSSVTRDAPHTLRVITLLPIPMILSAFGIVSFATFVQNKVKKISLFFILTVYLVILFGFTENYMDKYFNKYPANYSWSWQYGYEEAIHYVKEHYTEFDKIIFSKKYGEPHLFILGLWPWDANSYRNDPNLNRFEQTQWFWVDQFDKFYFVNDWDIPTRSDLDFQLESGEIFDCDNQACLLITSPDNHPPDWKLVHTVNFLNEEKAFEIFETRP